MTGPKVTRRSFALAAAGLAGGSIQLANAAAPGTAREIMSRLQTGLGQAPPNSVDGFLAGDPDTPVKGIATTAMATMDVLRQASKRGLNTVITFENTFFGQAQPAPPGGGRAGGAGRGRAGQQPLGSDDPVYKAKKEFIEKNGLTVFRLRDQWTSHVGNPLATGLANALGWSRYQVAGDPTTYKIPSIPLETLVADVRKRLNMRAGIRVTGERRTDIRTVAVLPGNLSLETALKRLPAADLMIAGQSQEWDVAEYAADAATAGLKKGYIMLGVVVSEDPGMRSCADWIKTTVKGVPVEWIGTGDPYWRPA